MDESGSRDRALGDLLVEQGLASRGQIDECLSLLARLREGGAAPVPTLGSLLLQKGYLSSSGYEKTLRLSGGPSSAPTAEVPPDVLATMADPARHVGKFVTLSLLGRGGMGEVWKAWDRDLGRFVALKLVLGQDPGEEQRLRVEAMTAGGLAHPHIAPVYETGTHEGRTFIAMQLVQGTTLAKADLALRPLLEVVRDAARALEFAHRNGVIHRDVKPDNLMVAGRHVYVMDFGLARQAARGAIVGTPAFMSPEQARGEADRLDGRSDVCSLGATLYALLSGRPPREGQDLSEILRKAASEEPVPPRRHRPSIPGEVEAIVLKAMELDPSRRYASAQEMADDLQRFLDGEPIRARKATVGYRLRKFVLRKRAAVAIAAVAVLAVGILVPRWLSERAARERERVEHAEREAALKELGALWGQVAIEKQGLHNPGNDPQKVLERIRGAVDRVGDFTRRHPGYPQGWYVRGMGRLHLDDLAGAEEDLREALRRNGAFTPAHTLLARVLIERHTRGVTSLEREAERRGREAEGFLTAAREHLAKAGTAGSAASEWGLPRTADDEVTEVLGRALGAVYLESDPDRARRILEEARGRQDAAEYWNWLGRLAFDDGKEVELQTRALEKRAHFAKAYLDRGAARQAKDPLGAIADYTAALRVSPRNGTAYVNRAVVRAQVGEYDGAVDDYSRALEIDPSETRLYALRGMARRDGGDDEGAVADLTRAIELDARDARAFSARGSARARLGELDEALEDCTRAIGLDGGFADAYGDRAGVRFLRGELAPALADATRAVGLKEDEPGPWSLRGLVRFALAEAEPARARDHLKAAESDVETALRKAGPHWPRRATAEGLLGEIRARLK